VTSGKTPYLRFDRNDYSIPPKFVRKPLTMVISHDTVRILDGAVEVASHPRCYDRGREIEDARHIEALIAIKRAARGPKGRDQMSKQLPHAEAFFERLLEREVPLAQATGQLKRMVGDYGATATDAALAFALERETTSLASIALWLEQQRRKRQTLPRVPIELPDRPGVRQLAVTPHNLETYDALARHEDHTATRNEEDNDD
jgi:hypothetical protein